MGATKRDDMPGMAKPQETGHDMAGMDHGAMDHGAMGYDAMGSMHGLLGGYGLAREASGTSWQPEAASHAGLHLPAKDWMVMLHGRVNGIANWQSGPRGGDQVFSTSMAMVMASKVPTMGNSFRMTPSVAAAMVRSATLL